MRQIVTADIDARPLAAGRIAVGLSSFVVLVEWFGTLNRVAGGAIAVPVASALPDPSPTGVYVLACVGFLASVGMVLGLSRWPTLAVAAVSLCALLLDQQTYSNHLVLLTVLAFFLGLSGSHRAWSIPHRHAGARVPYWPAFLIQAQISTLYFWTGVAKLNEQFLTGGVFEINMHTWALPPAALLPVVAVSSVITEVALSVLLWVRRLFPVALLVGVGLHLGIAVTLKSPIPLVAFAGLMASGYFLFGYRWWSGRRRVVADASDPS